MIFTIKIADYTFRIDTIFKDSILPCKDYLVDCDKADYSLKISDEDIAYEDNLLKKIIKAQGIRKRMPVFSEMEKTAIYRKILNLLFNNNIIMMHGAVVSVGSQSVLFSAKSGVGKTTQAKLWVDNIPDARILNGDKPLLKISDDSIITYSTPWCGKEHFGYNGCANLKSIFIIERSSTNKVTSMSLMESFQNIFGQFYVPDFDKNSVNMFKLFTQIYNNVKIYKLQCNMDKEAAIIAYNAAFTVNQS